MKSLLHQAFPSLVLLLLPLLPLYRCSISNSGRDGDRAASLLASTTTTDGDSPSASSSASSSLLASILVAVTAQRDSGTTLQNKRMHHDQPQQEHYDHDDDSSHATTVVSAKAFDGSRQKRRNLQGDTNKNRYCEALLDQTYVSDYERFQEACACTSNSGSSSNAADVVQYTVNCSNYQYCQECLPPQQQQDSLNITICGTQQNTFVYNIISNDGNKNSTTTEVIVPDVPTTRKFCIAFTSAGVANTVDDFSTVCYEETQTMLETNSNNTFTCEFTVGGVACASCSPSDCGNGRVDVKFDCSNVFGDSGAITDRCQDSSSSNSTSPAVSPGGAVIGTGSTLTFDTCRVNPNPTDSPSDAPSLPAPTTKAPTTTSPTTAAPSTTAPTTAAPTANNSTNTPSFSPSTNATTLNPTMSPTTSYTLNVTMSPNTVSPTMNATTALLAPSTMKNATTTAPAPSLPTTNSTAGPPSPSMAVVSSSAPTKATTSGSRRPAITGWIDIILVPVFTTSCSLLMTLILL